ncbi:hypothetical protein OROGR_030265 [Orobanche gracilis]
MDPITKDYKVVRIWNFSAVKYDFSVDKAEIFSQSANSCRPKGESWNILDDGPLTSLYYSSSDEAYLNGKYYWCLDDMAEGWGGKPSRIVWFDMGAEVFGLIELPSLCPDPYPNRLTVFKESSLAMVRHACKVENKHMYEIWIMDEVGLAWRNYATVGPLLDMEDPLGSWKNEELVVFDTSYKQGGQYMPELYIYNVKTHVKKKIMQGVDFDLCLPLAIYNESLVSVLGED